MRNRPLEIEFQFFADCPSHEAALQRLKAVLAEAGARAQIRVVEVTEEAQARRLSFWGSPTILINGNDIAPPPPGAQPGLACRAYRLDDGRISPLPTAAMIRRALRRALES